MSERNGHITMAVRDEVDPAGPFYPLPGTNAAGQWGVTTTQANSRFAADKRGRIYFVYFSAVSSDTLEIADHDGQFMFQTTHAAVATETNFGPLGLQFENGFRVEPAGTGPYDFFVVYEVD